MSKMSNLALEVEEMKSKYTLKAGDTIKCKNKYEAECLAYGLECEKIFTKCVDLQGHIALEVTKVGE